MCQATTTVRYRSLGEIFWESICTFATPKQKVTHSAKRRKLSNYHISLKRNISLCQVCGNPKLLHVLCWFCLKKVIKFEKTIQG